MRLLDRDGLAEKGIKHSSTQIWRLVKAHKFPAPVKVGGKNAWVEKEIDKYIAERIAARDKLATEAA